eukprot:Skav220910  [mRNA]  locus=scaffold1145:7800:16310:+ [translate_table: standard]
MLHAFRYLTSSGSMERDPVQFSLWGSPDNVSWIHLYSQNETSAVPTARGAPTAWYVVSTTSTTTTTTGSVTSTSTSSSTSSFSSTSTLPLDEAVRNALGNLEESKLSFLSLLDGLNSSSNGLLAQKVDVQQDGTVLLGVAMSVPEDGSPVAFGHGDIKVEVPSAILESLGVPGVAVMGVIPPSSGLFGLLNSSKGGLQSEVLSLDLFANGTAVKDLVEPIQLTLASSPDQPAICAFLDEELNEWSTSGLSVVSIRNGTLVCATNHLSIFGAILDSAFAALACSNAAAIFSEKGLESLGSRLWIFELAAVLNWVMLLIGFFLLAYAHRVDRRYKDAMENIQIVSGLSSKRRAHSTLRKQHHLKDLIFEELQMALDTGPVRIAYSRMLRAQTGLSLKQLKSLYAHSGHSKVHVEAEDFLLAFEAQSWRARLFFWYRMNCIWFTVLNPSPRTSCMVRTSVLLGKIYSGWALSAIFYGASSIAPGEEDGCTPVEGLLDQLVRALVVQLISSAFGALPFVALVFFFYKLTMLSLWLRRAIFWILPVFFLAAIFTVVVVFLRSREKERYLGHEHARHPVLPWPAFESLQTYELRMQSLDVLEHKVKKRRCSRTDSVAEGKVFKVTQDQILMFSDGFEGKIPVQRGGRSVEMDLQVDLSAQEVPELEAIEDGGGRKPGRVLQALNGSLWQLQLQEWLAGSDRNDWLNFGLPFQRQMMQQTLQQLTGPPMLLRLG